LEYYQRPSTGKRLRLILLLMAAWDILGVIVQLYPDTFAFHVKGEVSGFLAARAFSGALIIPAVVYIYAIRDPLRHRAVLWLAVIEQLVAICTAVFHLAADDFGVGSMVLPLAVSVVFLIVVLVNYPRGEEKEEAANEAGPET
jgi:hypothetical protein